MDVRKHLSIAQAGISVVLLALIFRGFDWTAFGEVLHRVPVTFYLVALLVTTTGQVLYAFKWFMAMRAMGMTGSFRQVLARYIVGVFFNNFLPSTIGGDWAKAYYLAQRDGYAAAGASVFIDRYLGVLFLVVPCAVLLWLPTVSGDAWQVPKLMLTLLAIGLAGGGMVAVIAPEGRMASRWLARENAIGRIAAQASQFAAYIRVALRRGSVVGAGAGTVAVYFVLLAAVYQRFFAVVGGVQVGFVPVLTAIGTISALSMIPVTINGLGLREQLHVALLATIGVSREVAVAASLMLFSHLIVISLAGLIIWLFESRRLAAAATVAS